MPYRKYTVGEYSTAYPTDVGYLVVPSTFTASAATRVIIGCHGHGGTGYQYGVAPLEPHTTALVNAGYPVFGIDHARINSWGDPDAMRALDDAYTYVTTTLGMTNTKVGLMGWSMGGCTALNWAQRNPSKVSCVWAWNPVTDLRFFRDNAAAYTPAYSIGGATGGNYTSEINTTFSTSSAAVGGYTLAAVGGAGVTMTITTGTGIGFADGHNSGVVGLPQATVAGVAFTYTGKTDSTLIGCVSTTASTITVVNGNAITSSYAAQSNGYRLRDEPASWNGLGIKIKICQASDDTVVPPAQSSDGTLGFVALVNDANMSLRLPAPSGGHVNSIAAVPTSEVVAFYQANL